ncbi:MAG: Gfo/Idh/MocA family protein, partial [Chthoniobacterales bacterium]
MSTDGMTHAPKGKPRPVCRDGEFIFAATHLDHGHIGGMINGLTEAGGKLKWIYDTDPERAKPYLEANPGSKFVDSFDRVLEDSEVQLVASAAVPVDRGPIGCQAMRAGKDYFTDKSPFTTLEQLEEAKKVQVETGMRYFVYFSERLHSEAGMYASQLVQDGVIGRVIQVLGLGPHRL